MSRGITLFLLLFVLLPGSAFRAVAEGLQTVDEIIEADDQLIENAQAESEKSVGGMHIANDSEFADWSGRVYIDPDLKYVKITNKPGQSWQDCAKDRSVCHPVNAKSYIVRDGQVKILTRKELNLSTGEEEDVEYMKVRFRDSAGKEDEGWIETSSLRQEELKPIYNTDKDVPSHLKVCPATDSPMTETANQLQLGQAKEAIEGDMQDQLGSSTEAVRDLVGQCPLGNPRKKKQAWKNQNIYDFEVYPRLEKQKASFPTVLKEDAKGRVISQKASLNDVVGIDTLARTLYSEMNECFSVGVQYPMAAAKVALNRVKDYEDDGSPKLFVSGPQVKSKPNLSKVLTAPYQFSVWNYDAKPKDMTVLMSLCPAKDSDSTKNWKGHKPTPDDTEAWDLALKIATEAVLFPKRFKEKTKDVTQLYYTSKRGTYDGRKAAKPAPKIEGRSVKSFKCMYLWEGK